MTHPTRPAAGRPPATVRTYHPRRAPLRTTAAAAMAELWPRVGFHVDDDAPDRGVPRGLGLLLADVADPATGESPLDRRALFGRDAPLVVEIGSGTGEALVAMAEQDPDRDYLGVEVHVPGLARTLVLLGRSRATNVRLAFGDALDLLARRVPPSSLDAVHAFFPDPWPKARHHKRRLVTAERVALLRSRLRPGGTFHCATDWGPYAEQTLGAVDADPGLRNVHDGYAPRPAHRPVTKFERRALEAGHEVHDVVAVRVA